MSVVLFAAACADQGGGVENQHAAATALPDVRIAEIHYDNAGTDTGEAIEVSGPAGTDLSGWSLVFYNGNGGAAYDTKALSGTITDSCGGRGVVVVPALGLQNGSPDGIALVSPAGLVEFLSYEGTFAGVGGVADAVTSVDIGVSETGLSTEPPGLSLKRAADGSWSGPTTANFGTCNDAGEPPPPPGEVAAVAVAPASATVTVNGTQTFTASATDASGNPVSGVTFTWSSSNETVATVTAAGVATGHAAGDTTITATAPNGVAGSASLHVNEVTPPPPTGDVRFSEIHYDNTGADLGEALEISGPMGTSVDGWKIVLYNQTGGAQYDTRNLTGTFDGACGGTRGVLVFNYPPEAGIQNGPSDGFALVDSTGAVVEFLSYEGTLTATNGPAVGLTSVDIGVAEEPSAIGESLQRRPDGSAWFGPTTASFGACNPDAPPPPPKFIQFSGRSSGDVPLPVGFQAQLFASLMEGGSSIPTTFVWSSDTPDIASIDQNGVYTSLAAGTAVLRATAADGTTGTTSLPTRIAVASTTALYEGNAEFGEPTDADPSDDYIVHYEQYTSSYNPILNHANWTSYEIDPTHFGAEDRCNCFTFDDSLPASFLRLTTNDYTGSGAIAGYGIDRGHLARSFDRTSGSLDNARTFLFTNIIPQAADNNQGPWAAFENDLGNYARNVSDPKEVYVIAGASGNKGTLKNEGKVGIPTQTWKVAVLMPHDQGLENIHDYRDLQVLAVIMPNEPGIRNVPWQTYLTTVDAVEELSGYDILALLPDDVEAAVESGTQPAIVSLSGPVAGSEGSSVSFSADAVDPNGTVASITWSFGDGATATGASVTHTYAQDGAYTVRVDVVDGEGLTTSKFTTASIANVAPAVGAVAGATGLLPGESFTVSGSFTDPGADAWTASVDWGDGSSGTLTVTGQSFSGSHTYTAAGTFTVTVSVADDDTSSATTTTVTVGTVDQALVSAKTIIDGLVSAGKLNRTLGMALKLQIDLARVALSQGQVGAAVLVLKALVIQVDAFVSLRQISATDAAPLRALLVRMIDSLT